MSLLPPNSTATERAIEGATERASGMAVPVDTLWNPATCPAPLLPWLAWALSVDIWDSQWLEARQRAVIAASIEIHRRKGTLGSIRRALETAGYGAAIVRETWTYPRLGRGYALGRGWRLGPTDPHWANYEVEITEVIDRRAADALASRLAAVAPARCQLRRIYLSGVQHVLGRGVWTLGNQVPLGGVYSYEVN